MIQKKIVQKMIFLFALTLLPGIGNAAVFLSDSRSLSCAELNSVLQGSSDGVVYIGTHPTIKFEYFRDVDAAFARGACPGRANSYPTYVVSRDSGGRRNCQFGIACDYRTVD